MDVVISRGVIEWGFQPLQDRLCFVPLAGILTDVTAQNHGVHMPGVDHLHGASKVVCGVRRMGFTQVRVTELRDCDLRVCGSHNAKKEDYSQRKNSFRARAKGP